MNTHAAATDHLPQHDPTLIHHRSHLYEGLALLCLPSQFPYTSVLLICPPLLTLRHPTMPFTPSDRCTCGPITLVMRGVLTATGGPVAVSLSGKRQSSGDATILSSATGLELCLPPCYGAKCNHGCPNVSTLPCPFMFCLHRYLREADVNFVVEVHYKR